MWARNEVRRRWKALVALGLMAGLVGGLALAAVAGARRTGTAYARFREATGRSDAIVFGTQLGIRFPDYSKVRTLPEVEDAGEFVFGPIALKELPGSSPLGPGDDRLYQTVNRPLVVKGRLPDVSRDNEILVNRQAAKKLRIKVGDRFTLVSAFDFPQSDTAPIEGGPSVAVTVVGIGDSNMDLVFQGDQPSFIPSAAFLAERPEIPRTGNLVVRLRPGTDVTAFRNHVAEVMGLPNIPVRDQAEDTKRITHGTDLERNALLLFAAALALAGLVLVGQALARTVYAVAEAARPLGAMGFTRNGLLAGLVFPFSIPAAVAVLAALTSAVALSSRFPVGLAGRVEPDRGFHVDWLVLAPGAALVVLAVLAGAAISALRATSSSRGRARAVGRLSLVPFLRRVASLPAVIGAGLALERGEGSRALPVRPALAGAVAAILGVVGAFGLLTGIEDALRQPARSGQFWDLGIRSDGHVPEALAAVEADRQMTEITVMRFADLDIDGAGIPAYASRPVKANKSFTLLSGRKPASPTEAVIGPATARALRKAVGDTIQVGGTDGREIRVVGLGLLPQTPHFSFDQGAWLTNEGFDGLTGGVSPDALHEEVLVGLGGGLSADAAIARLTGKVPPDAVIEPSSLPQDVGYLRNVRSLPKALAAFLVLLGLGALGHVLVTAVRRRRHDLAVLRAIGFRPLQVAGCIVWQAVVVTVVALVIGIPLGIVAGRWAWRWVADSTPMLYVPPLAAAAVLLVIPGALVAANVLAAWPARRAARLRPADVLRAE